MTIITNYFAFVNTKKALLCLLVNISLILNNKNPQGLAQLYPGWVQSLPMLKAAALKEVRFAGLPKNWQQKFKSKQKEDISFYNLPGLPRA